MGTETKASRLEHPCFRWASTVLTNLPAAEEDRAIWGRRSISSYLKISINKSKKTEVSLTVCLLPTYMSPLL